jgi:hypothetical protein
MCQACPPGFAGESRRTFLRRLAWSFAAVGLGAAAGGTDAEPVGPASSRSGWAHLITPDDGRWDYHDGSERRFLRFLAPDPQMQYAGDYLRADPMDFGELCRSPFLFTWDLGQIPPGRAWSNLREYLYRGGFLYIDNCVNLSPDAVDFRDDHISRLTRLLPSSECRRLPPGHAIFRTRYPMKVSDLPEHPVTPPECQKAFYGVFDDDRMVALISLSHLFCGWGQRPADVEPCLRQLANIYLYARTN